MSSASSLSSSPPPDQCGSRLFNGRSRRQNVDYGVRNQLISQLNKRELYGLDVYRWEDDDLALRHAASNARLPYDRMTLRELQIFVEMTRSQASINLFLYLRNRILVLWQLDPLIELTIEAIQKEIPEPYNSDYELVKGVHNYLQRYGYINFGVFLPLSNFVLDKPHRIIIIGAGTSGLIAARQLKFFGFDVTVLEGRQRTGGRVFTIRQPGLGLPPVDSGGMIINGIIGNPLITLIQQNLCNVVRMNPKCPIYDSRGQGKMVDARKDDMIQKSFNRILSTISYIVHNKEITDIGGDENGRGSRKISLGEAFQLILDQHELRVQSRRLNYWKKYELLCNKLRAAIDRIKYSRKAIDECMEQLRKNGISIYEPTPEMLTINFEDCTPREEFIQKLGLRCIRKCLQLALKEFEEAEQERKDIEHILNDYKNMEPSHVFMNDTDKRILDFHLANLEYGIGGPLSSVALKDWDLDDPYGFAGSHMTVKEGLGSVIERLHADLKIELNSVVNHVEYNEQGVSVKYIKQKQENKSPTPSNHQSQETSEIHTLQADAVLCTVPLGVLKMSPFLSEGDESGNGAIRFQPPLPTWKREAITRLGFGNLNKLILFFEKPFWDITKSSFGRLNDICTARGELFLFFTNGDLPILIGLFAGEAAAVTSQFDEEVVVQRGMKALHSIFGNICPPKPINFKITRWHVDRFSRGCYSYMSSNSLADDYDLLARPIHPNEDESILPRIFFAGEHTNRQHPSSVHGAFLSGLREAAQIADTFIGQLSFSGQNFHLDEESAELLASSYDEQLNIGKNAESSRGQNGEEQQNNHCEEENEVNGTESLDSDSDIELL